MINSQIDTCNSWLSDGKVVINDFENTTAENIFPGIVNTYRKIQIQGYLTWLDWCKESLKEGNK